MASVLLPKTEIKCDCAFCFIPILWTYTTRIKTWRNFVFARYNVRYPLKPLIITHYNNLKISRYKLRRKLKREYILFYSFIKYISKGWSKVNFKWIRKIWWRHNEKPASYLCANFDDVILKKISTPSFFLFF